VVKLICVLSVTKFLSHRFTVILLLPLLFLAGLIAIPGYAQSGTATGEHRFSDHLSPSPAGNLAELNPISNSRAGSTGLAQSGIPVLDEDPLEVDKKPQEKQKSVEPLTRQLPIWGEKARAKGYDLPLPFGAGANLVFMDQGIQIRNVKVGIGDPIFEVSGLAFSDARSHDAAVTGRLDVWLLPFVNIYGIFGAVNGESELDLDIGSVTGALPPIGLPPIFEPGTTIDLNIDYNGTTYGGGMTLVGGYKNFFGSVDANYTFSNIDVVDGEIKTYTVTPRVGWLVDSTKIPGSLALWVGAMYMRYRQTITDDINLQEIDPRLPSVNLDFKLDVKNDQPWNFLFGGQWEITKRWQFTVEGGIGDRKQLITGLFFRF
jgi:hypothetical protein